MNTIKKNTSVYGGENTNVNPFNINDTLRHRFTLDHNNILVDGKGLYEFIGMKGDMMQLKTLNEDAAYGTDTINSSIIKHSKKAGYGPKLGDTVQLHYMYADRFTIIK